MKKRLIAFVVLLLLLVVVSSAVALPLNCEYCGSSTAPQTVITYPVEYYKTSCIHHKCGYDSVSVAYTVVKSYCGSCTLPREEVWTQQSKMVTCHGWLPNLEP